MTTQETLNLGHKVQAKNVKSFFEKGENIIRITQSKKGENIITRIFLLVECRGDSRHEDHLATFIDWFHADGFEGTGHYLVSNEFIKILD